MLLLTTPITVHPDVYNAIAIVRVDFDLRVQRAVMHLSLAKVTDTHVYIGAEETGPGGTEYLFPELIRTVELSQDLANPDPVTNQLMRAFAIYLENFEQVLVGMQNDPGGLATVPLQLGTRKWSLACTFAPLGDRIIGREVRG